MKNKHGFARCLIASATSLALAAPVAAGAATDWFLKIDGIKGESLAEGHKVVISSVADSGSPSDRPVESISLRFGSAKVTYKQQNADGSLGTPIETTLKGGGG